MCVLRPGKGTLTARKRPRQMQQRSNLELPAKGERSEAKSRPHRPLLRCWAFSSPRAAGAGAAIAAFARPLLGAASPRPSSARGGSARAAYAACRRPETTGNAASTSILRALRPGIGNRRCKPAIGPGAPWWPGIPAGAASVPWRHPDVFWSVIISIVSGAACLVLLILNLPLIHWPGTGGARLCSSPWCC